jgi:hypothetical protein
VLCKGRLQSALSDDLPEALFGWMQHLHSHIKTLVLIVVEGVDSFLLCLGPPYCHPPHATNPSVFFRLDPDHDRCDGMTSSREKAFSFPRALEYGMLNIILGLKKPFV